jgi:gliding motility-associated-like protein
MTQRTFAKINHGFRKVFYADGYQLKLSVLFTLVCCCNWSYGQFHAQRRQELKANSNWFFGADGVNFNLSPPQVIPTPQYFQTAIDYEDLRIPLPFGLSFRFQTHSSGARYNNAIPVSHPRTGSFLFMAFPHQVYDRNFNPMPDGSFNPLIFDPVSYVKHIAVAPFIKDTNRYYMFNISPDSEGLTYSVVDMQRNNGLGDIDPAIKTVTLMKWPHLYSEPEIIGLVPGNNCDTWLLVAENLTTESTFRIYAFRITENGISTTPVTTAFPKQYLSQIFWDYQVSPDRKTIAFVALNMPQDTLSSKISEICFYRFDPETGAAGISHLPRISVPLKDMGFDIHGSFTPDNRCYIVSNNDYRSLEKKIYLTRYDLSAYYNTYNQEQFSFPLSYWILSANMRGACQTVPATIYFKPYNNTLYFNVPQGFPEGCPGSEGKRIYADDITWLGNLTSEGGSGWGQNSFAPNMSITIKNRFFTGSNVVYPYTPTDTLPDVYLDSVFCYDPAIPFPQVTLEAKPGFSNYVWNDGTSGTTKTINQSGKYWVYYTGPCNSRVDTFTFRFRERKKLLPPDTIVCDQRFPVDIQAGDADRYQWEDNSTGQIRRIYHPGTYAVTFEALGCTQFDTIEVKGEFCPCNVSVPNAFSPNNDGLNDYFKPVMGLGCVPEQYSMRIYNRWGQLVYKSNNEFDKGWDGSTNGNTADGGVYFYELQFNTPYRSSNYYHKGELILVR